MFCSQLIEYKLYVQDILHKELDKNHQVPGSTLTFGIFGQIVKTIITYGDNLFYLFKNY